MRTYTLYWKDEDTNRVRSEEFSNKTGWDHSAMDAALEMAEEANDNGFPWLLEEDGCQVAHGNNGDLLGLYRYQGSFRGNGVKKTDFFS